jgi:hypothetical protein
MLQFGSKLLPQCELVYVAFRLACVDTRERLELAHQLDLSPERNFGFLMEVPFLRNVPAQVQMDLLLTTWSKYVDPATHAATLLDESVLYAACETSARIVRTDPEVARRFISRGPVDSHTPLNSSTADALQKLHLSLAQNGLFLLLSQFQDIPPREAVPLKQQWGLQDENAECLFDVLGRWYVSTAILSLATGLLTRVETEQLGTLLNAARCCQSPIT